MASNQCPCHSGRRYAECCGPFHRGVKTPETPEQLMRARYAAFARGEIDFLSSTLTANHPDRAMTPADWRKAREGIRYLGLDILHTKTEGDVGEVKFHARLFKSGVDCSFTELSHFVRENGRWTYAAGEQHLA